MASSSSYSHPLVVALCYMLTGTVFLMFAAQRTGAQLTPFYYQNSCPGALDIIKKGVAKAVGSDRRMAASLIRLHFHDCFVLGCDASILLDDSISIESEKDAAPNANSVRGYEVIDRIKADLENLCPGVFSCADIVTVAARDSSAYVGGPTWKVKLGRRDSRTASRQRAENDLPSFQANLNRLITVFQQNGLSARDLVALSGAHTIGLARCVTFRDRLYSNSSFIDTNFQKQRKGICSSTDQSDNGNTAALDLVTPMSFDNNYFKNLLRGKGLLTSDQNLYDGKGGSTDQIVMEYSRDPNAFYRDFAAAMVRMSQIHVLTGSHGEVRRNCRRLN